MTKTEKESLKDWPFSVGRYKVGNKHSCVAVCSNATVEGIELDMSRVAILGKCVTENIGIEKIIENIVSNPNIRFLILCGKVSKGHFVSQAIVSLVNNGIDENKRIIGAKGNTPFLKGIDEKLIERFRKQITPINLIGNEDSGEIMKVVEDCLRKNPGSFTGQEMEIEKVEEVEVSDFSEWIPDPKGFFVISVDRNKNRIVAEHYQDNKLKKRIIGDSAEKVSKTIVKLGLIGDFKQDKMHAIYLGRELQKAEIALKNNLDYQQDSKLIIKKVEQENIIKKDHPVDENGWFD